MLSLSFCLSSFFAEQWRLAAALNPPKKKKSKLNKLSPRGQHSIQSIAGFPCPAAIDGWVVCCPLGLPRWVGQLGAAWDWFHEERGCGNQRRIPFLSILHWFAFFLHFINSLTNSFTRWAACLRSWLVAVRLAAAHNQPKNKTIGPAKTAQLNEEINPNKNK